MKRVKLQVPRLSDMEYRREILSQPETMSYNKGKDIEVESYHRDTGCIDFPREDWRYWRQMWLMNEPDFFSALICDEESGEFVGEVCYFYDGEAQTHVAGVLIEACHRGKGFCAPALKALAGTAFRREEVAVLRCDVREDDAAAVTGYTHAGFRCFGKQDGVCAMLLIREDYERMNEKDI
ncbi:MAG: GNAT family N-acetyltransferase [Clostridiales bacterium]|nr:GNAT family N-acetyltransferase [Clostridiales bacterium]